MVYMEVVLKLRLTKSFQEGHSKYLGFVDQKVCYNCPVLLSMHGYSNVPLKNLCRRSVVHWTSFKYLFAEPREIHFFFFFFA